MADRRGNPIFFLTVGIFLLGALVAPSSARASCGDYVMIERGRHNRPGDAFDTKTPGEPLAVPAKPCSGPHCRQVPGQLPAPIGESVSNDAPSQDAFVAKSLTGAPIDRREHLAGLGCRQFVQLSSAIFHPPRS